MTLAEIAEVVQKSRAAGLTAVEYRTETGMLRLRLGRECTSSPPGQILAQAKAACAGVFFSAHPARAHLAPPRAASAQGEIVAFLAIGPCLRAVQSPTPGILRRRASENSLVGYGEVLFEIASGS